MRVWGRSGDEFCGRIRCHREGGRDIRASTIYRAEQYGIIAMGVRFFVILRFVGHKHTGETLKKSMSGWGMTI